VKTILIIDTQWIGHIPMYHFVLVSRLLALNYRVISISPKPDKAASAVGAPSPQDKIYFSKIAIDQKSDTKAADRAIAWWERCRREVGAAVKATGWTPDLVFFPGIETNIISRELTGEAVERLFPYNWAGLYLTPKYLRKSFIGFRYKKLFRKDRFFQARNCIGVAVLDENVVERLAPLVAPTKIFVMPDFTNTELPSQTDPLPDLLAKIKAKSGDRKIIGFVGEISKRKGVTTLIDVATLAKKYNKDWFFIFTGAFNERNNNATEFPFIKNKIERAPDNCFFHLQRIEKESDFNGVINTCDVVFAGYEKFYHSSNLITKAAAFQKPIVVSQGYCMQERIDKFKLGLAIPENDPESAYAAISALLKGEDFSHRSLIPEDKAYASLQSLDRLDEFLENLISAAQNKKGPQTYLQALLTKSSF
jgi:glycosyltransferase involved in cell wall biosynthesis